MTLTERYLKAVAAQLPKATRDDIVAELRDAIETRMEAREEQLGRAPTEAEQEAVLREMGHPLAVAAPYGSGPLHVVGPELYPWWMFGVKVGLIALAAIIALGAVVRVLIGDEYVGEAIGQAFASLFSGAVTLIGFATIAGFIIERQAVKPAFLREWRVRDLGLFELAGLDADAVSRLARGERRPRSRLSPTAGALASAAAWVVILLWWTGVLNVTGLRIEDLGTAIDGVDYGAMLGQVVRAIYWPVILYAVAHVLFDLNRAVRPEAVRLTAFGDLAFAAAEAGLFLWLWQASPLSPVIRVDSAQAFVERVRDTFGGGDWTLAAILMMGVAFGMVQALFQMSGALWRLVSGRTPGDREPAAA